MISKKNYKALLVIPLFLLSVSLSIAPAWSEVVVPYKWIVPGAYAKFIGYKPLQLFYPNHTEVYFLGEVYGFLEWTVVDRVGDSVKLNVTFFVEGNAALHYTKSLPDGFVDKRDITVVAEAFGTEPYQVRFDPNADITGSEGEPDQKVNIWDLWFVAKAFGSSQGNPRYNPKADVAPERKWDDGRHVVHCKTLLLDVNVYSRETSLDGKPLGKTCFWAEPYADVGDEIALYGLPPEEIKGTVEYIDDEYMASWPGITVYKVYVLQLDPFVWFSPFPCFDWHTGMAMIIDLQGAQPKPPDLRAGFNFANGSRYEIKRYAGAPIATQLNIGYDWYPLVLNFTNVQIGPPS